MRKLVAIAADLAFGVPLICVCFALELWVARGSERAQVIEETQEWP